MRALYRKLKPDIVHHVALVPSLLGSIAALGLPMAKLNALAGLGFIFTSGSAKARLLRPVAALVLRFSAEPAEHDGAGAEPGRRSAWWRSWGSPSARIAIIPGSGVDTDVLQPLPEPPAPMTVGFVGRLLDDKGVAVLVRAHDRLRQRGLAVRTLLAGTPDPSNPASIPPETLAEWRNHEGLELLGHVSDIAGFWARAHIAVLPSRREGLPKSLLEAAACGRPIVATDVPGCREVARPDLNALLVPVDDDAALADAIAVLGAGCRPAETARRGRPRPGRARVLEPAHRRRDCRAVSQAAAMSGRIPRIVTEMSVSGPQLLAVLVAAALVSAGAHRALAPGAGPLRAGAAERPLVAPPAHAARRRHRRDRRHRAGHRRSSFWPRRRPWADRSACPSCSRQPSDWPSSARPTTSARWKPFHGWSCKPLRSLSSSPPCPATCGPFRNCPGGWNAPACSSAAVWFVNLVNFMDGIDWITVVEVVPITAALVVFGLTGALPPAATFVAMALCGGMIGFAPFNRPVARLFLGDVGSLPIGLLLTWLLILLAGSGHLAAALLLPLYYLADSTITLLCRLAKGEPVMAAHRSHFYQRALDNGFSVTEVVARVFVVNLALIGLAAATVLSAAPVLHAVAIAAGCVIVGLLLVQMTHAER